jgi:hypothetical protein
MKSLAAVLALLSISVAHAELLVPKGTKATLRVEYTFASQGEFASLADGENRKWSVRNVVNITANYAADAAQPLGVMHADDAQQQTNITALQSQATAANKKLQPMANDMQAIAAKCGISMTNSGNVSKAQEQAQEACIAKAVSGYADNLEVSPDMQSAGGDIKKMGEMGAGKRFQLWQLVSQSGNYSVNERRSRDFFEMTCSGDHMCKRLVVRKGGGEILSPPGGRSIAGASIFEVDSAKKDLVLKLPLPLTPLESTQTVTSTYSYDKDVGTTKSGMTPWMMPVTKPMTIAVPADLRSASGNKTFKIEGKEAEGGTLTVNWQFSPQ